MKKTLTLILPLLAIAAFSGCVTQRSVSFPGRDYDTVFRGAIKGLCKNPDIVVYQADKVSGEIRLQSRNLLGGAPDTALLVSNVGGTPQISMTMPGPNNPWVERFIQEASTEIPAAAAAPAPAVTPDTTTQQQQNLDLEKQKLELEKQKLELEKQKLEFEKQKLEQKK